MPPASPVPGRRQSVPHRPPAKERWSLSWHCSRGYGAFFYRQKRFLPEVAILAVPRLFLQTFCQGAEFAMASGSSSVHFHRWAAFRFKVHAEPQDSADGQRLAASDRVWHFGFWAGPTHRLHRPRPFQLIRTTHSLGCLTTRARNRAEPIAISNLINSLDRPYSQSAA